MTGSVFLLGLVQATRAVPLLVLGPFGGVLADRMDRRRQLMVAQLLNMVLNVILAVVYQTPALLFFTVLTVFCSRAEVWFAHKFDVEIPQLVNVAIALSIAGSVRSGKYSSTCSDINMPL